jgi:hypothetical protein
MSGELVDDGPRNRASRGEPHSSSRSIFAAHDHRLADLESSDPSPAGLTPFAPTQIRLRGSPHGQVPSSIGTPTHVFPRATAWIPLRSRTVIEWSSGAGLRFARHGGAPCRRFRLQDSRARPAEKLSPASKTARGRHGTAIAGRYGSTLTAGCSPHRPWDDRRHTDSGRCFILPLSRGTGRAEGPVCHEQEVFSEDMPSSTRRDGGPVPSLGLLPVEQSPARFPARPTPPRSRSNPWPNRI